MKYKSRKLISLLLVVFLALGVTVFAGYAQNPNAQVTQVPAVTAAPRFGSLIEPDSVTFPRRMAEIARGFVVQPPAANVTLRPVERVPRERFGRVVNRDANGNEVLTLGLTDLEALVFPSLSLQARMQLTPGEDLFTRNKGPEEGIGPVFNDTRCLDCHLSGDQAPRGLGIIEANSNVSRAARATPTNFRFGTGDFTADGRVTGRHNGDFNNPNFDAISNTGFTASFTTFSDYHPDRHYVDILQGAPNALNGFAQNLGGFVQHRLAIPGCSPDAQPPLVEDLNLIGGQDENGVSPMGFRRAVAEFAGPPYIGRGLMEAVPNADLASRRDIADTQTFASSLNNPVIFACSGDCVTGRTNPIAPTSNVAAGDGRFGIRANGAEIFQFATGGANGGFSITTISPGGLTDQLEQPLQATNRSNPQCQDRVIDPELPLSFIISERNFIRATAPPEFGAPLLTLLQSPDPLAPQPAGSMAAQVQRGAQLFGIDLVAFANRMVPGRMPAGGDGRNPNAINTADVMVGCVTCHVPVQRTGTSPASNDPVSPGLLTDFEIVSPHVSNVWAPIFSDLLIHRMPAIEAERITPIPRTPVVIRRPDATGTFFNTFDIARNDAQDAFQNQNPAAGGALNVIAANPEADEIRFACSLTRRNRLLQVNNLVDAVDARCPAYGDEFRTPPLMGLGLTATPMFHDARVYLSRFTMNTMPAGTVTTNSAQTNAPLVIRTLDDVFRAAIEIHDLPAPGPNCPVPPADSNVNVNYGPNPASVICPSFDSPLSRSHRSDSREVIRRFRALTVADQNAMIAFLRQL